MNKSSSKTSVIISVGLLLSLVCESVLAQEYKKITQLGTNEAVCAGGVKTLPELQAFFRDNPEAASDIIRDAGSSLDVNRLLSAIEQGDVVERAYPVGTRLLWTSGKINGNYVAKPSVEWAGKQSFQAFQMDITSGCRNYNIVIPKECCNISLFAVQRSQVEFCEPDAKIQPEVAEKALPIVQEQPKPTVANADEKRIPSSLTPYLGAFYGSEKRARFRPLINEDQADSSEIYGVRIGLAKALSDRTSIFTQLSYYERGSIAPGNVDSDNNIALDIGIERRFADTLFVAAGIGAWNIDEDADLSVFAHIGGDILQSDFQWYLEGRLFDSDAILNDSLSDNKMFSAGIRYLAK